MSETEHHIPQGNPCKKCGKTLNKHRVYHVPQGDPCSICTLPASKHRITDTQKPRVILPKIIGLDGEGVGRNPHLYTMMGASDESGTYQRTLESKTGLASLDCLNFLIALPRTKKTKVFTFSFNYDLTMMLRDLDNRSLYLLFRPELRQRAADKAMLGPYPIKWKGFSLNLQGTKFTIKKGKQRLVIWDLFKFFQSKFVNALRDWKVGSPELWERMSRMKDKRGEFDKESQDDIRAYMLEECACMATLARKLIEAHELAGLKLKTFYGAGSSGGAMLTVMRIRDKIAVTHPLMKDAVASAFFGGRFENSVIGSIREPVWNYDISSAYPYHTTFLPCLIHGEWVHSKYRGDLDTTSFALVSYELGKTSLADWGPFPFRDKSASISFPITSGGGWVWRDEYLAGEQAFSHVKFKEAWIYRGNCDCKPFSGIPNYYKHRLLLGKEGPGIVIKLAVNSVYGKLAQSVGNALFNSWIWAGMITSGCRAQILDVLRMHVHRKNLLMIATDGIYTRERLEMPQPKDTDTKDALNDKGKRANKPLGGWEEKHVPQGIFVARPGIYFPLNPTEAQLKDIRGRGVGKGVILNNWQRIIEIWEREGVKGIATVANVTRFCGAKTSLSRSTMGHTRAHSSDGIAPSYGDWIARKVEMSFDPMPKRRRVNPDGLTLELREFPNHLRSVPYDRAVVSRETLEMQEAEQEILEQPDGDFSL